jgi:acyl transferase domain-containing protein
MTRRSTHDALADPDRYGGAPDEPVAVIGVACRLPQAADPAGFWRLLREGRSAVTAPPADRWPQDLAGTEPAELPRFGAFLDAVDGFDAEFFGVSPIEASTMDPQQRLALELSWEVLEDAGVVPERLRDSRTGVFVGAIWDDYAHLALRRGSAGLTAYSLTGLHRSIIANRVSHTFGLRGPSLTIDSGQSSSLVAVHLASESLRRGECRLALAGGVNLALLAETAASAVQFGGLSPDGRCFTFDARANGYVRGEGGGLVLLKPLSAALVDGDRVYAVIRGSATNNDGATRTLTFPSAAAQEEVLRLAYRRAAVPPGAVQYVELHGTGTPAGDPVEAAALGAVLGTAAGRTEPLLVGSAKTNVGHLEGAAGIVGLIKVALSLAHGEIPASLNFHTANPRIPLDAWGLAVVDRLAGWPHPDRERLAGVSAFGMGGTNCHVVLAGPPAAQADPAPAEAPTDRLTAWPLSTQDGRALAAAAGRLYDFAVTHPEVPAADIAHSLATTRSQLEHRAVVLGAARADLLAGLDALAQGRPSASLITGTARPEGGTVFVFSGQGTQWPGMAEPLLDTCPPFADRIAECDAALARHVDWSLLDVLRGTPGAPGLERVDVVQPVLFAMMVALAAAWESLGVVPDAVVGHSQGEIAAMCVAGGLSLVDAARVIAVRARAVASLAGTGGMASVTLPAGAVRDRLARWRGRLSVAAVNGPSSTVVSGPAAELAEFVAACAADGVPARAVAVDYAAHSAQVEPVRDQLLAELAGVTGQAGPVPFYSCVTGDRLDTAGLTRDYWYRNLREPVALRDATQALLAAGYRTFIEVSPHPVLTGGIEDTVTEVRAQGQPVPGATTTGTLRRGAGGRPQLLAAAAHAYTHGVPVDWAATAPAGVRRVNLPGYPFQRRRYWLDDAAPPPTPAPVDPIAGLRDRSPADQLTALTELVCAHTAAVLGHASSAAVEPGRTFKQLGLESAAAVQLRNRLVEATGVPLAATAAFDHPTPVALAGYLRTGLLPAAADPSPPRDDLVERIFSADPEELYALIDSGYARGGAR